MTKLSRAVIAYISATIMSGGVASIAGADIITMTVTGSVAPYQFGNGYYIAPVIDQTGLFGPVGANLANDPLTVLWTSNTITGVTTAVLTINGVAGPIFTRVDPVYSDAFLETGGHQVFADVTSQLGGPGNVSIDSFVRSLSTVFPTTGTPFDYTLGGDDNSTCCFPPTGIGGSFRTEYGPGTALDGYYYITHITVENPDYTGPPWVFSTPGPIAGAGLPGMIFATGGLLAWWRRKRIA
jgi:hypothetical protein